MIAEIGEMNQNKLDRLSRASPKLIVSPCLFKIYRPASFIVLLLVILQFNFQQMTKRYLSLVDDSRSKK